MKIIPVILCGGSGTRLWPLSRNDTPKQFLKLLGENSLLQNTVLRAQKVSMTNNENFVFVTLGRNKNEISKQLNELGAGYNHHILCEPMARNTAAAVALAAQYVADTFGEDAIMWVLPADHHIQDEVALMHALKQAILSALDESLATFGIIPTRPDTGYGYIRYSNELAAACVVEEFVEKPDLKTAQSYLDDGHYLWNSGMFVFQASTILNSFMLHAPQIINDISNMVQSGYDDIDADLYSAVESISFDYAIMERAKNVSVIPCSIGWSDIGSWESLWDIQPKDDNGNVVKGNAVLQDSENCLIEAKNRLIACAGVRDIVVIDAGDSILIADKSNSQVIKTLVGQLKGNQNFENHSWGTVNIISKTDGYVVQEVNVKPHQSIQKMTHADTAKSIMVVSGTVDIMNGVEYLTLSAGQSVSIAPKTLHSIINNTDNMVHIIETKCEPVKAVRDVLQFSNQNDQFQVA